MRQRGQTPFLQRRARGDGGFGAETGKRRWVKYEIKRSIELGKGLLGIDISKIRDPRGKTDTKGPNPLPSGYPLYQWNNDDGRANIGTWIETAAILAGR